PMPSIVTLLHKAWRVARGNGVPRRPGRARSASQDPQRSTARLSDRRSRSTRRERPRVTVLGRAAGAFVGRRSAALVTGALAALHAARARVIPLRLLRPRVARGSRPVRGLGWRCAFRAASRSGCVWRPTRWTSRGALDREARARADAGLGDGIRLVEALTDDLLEHLFERHDAL